MLELSPWLVHSNSTWKEELDLDTSSMRWEQSQPVNTGNNGSAGGKFPLVVQVEYHPGSKDAADVARYVWFALNDDPAVPGLRIPAYFTPDDGTMESPEPRLASEAERVLVVLLADDHLAANARRPTKSGTTWADYTVQLRDLCESTGNLFMPIQLTEHGWPIDTRLAETSFLRAWAVEGDDKRRRLIARRLVHVLIRHLRPHDAGEDAPAATIFLSHTKVDIDSEPHVVKALLEHLTANQPEKTWFDSGDIAAGSHFANAIEHGVADAALLAVVTDSYSSRSWCRREVLIAKRHQRPVLVVDAVQQREIRGFPYAGNAPVIRWNGNAEDVVDLLMRETLRHAFAEETLKMRRRPDDAVLPSGPELVTIVHRNKERPILYPDPPLGPEEIAVLSPVGIRLETPLERHARENNLRERTLIIALSVSEAEDLARFGLRKPHLDGALLELSRYLLLAGIRLAYGGHLKANGYTVRLADLLQDPIVAQLRGEPPTPATAPPELITYLAWPMPSVVQDEARLGPLVEIRRCDRPSDVDETLDPCFVPLPASEIPVDTPTRRFAWARGLTVMRERQTREVAARVIVGGRLGPAGGGYNGRMPGVLEEAFLSLQAGRPVYLVGAFGGCARLVFDALEGIPTPELTWEHQRAVPHSEELRRMYQERGQTWDEYESVADFLRGIGLPGLHNGLTVAENRELANARSGERIVELILRGLQQC